jgi:hypothetical protein
VAPAGETGLQFDQVTQPGDSTVRQQLAVECANCHEPIRTVYFTVNSQTVCDRCRSLIERLAEVPSGLGPFARAGLFGFGAGVAGAAVYYAVLAIAHLEIGIVAILIGYMVGAGVRKGARGHGGIRFQFLAIALTYASIALAYAPIAIAAAIAQNQRPAATASAPGAAQQPGSTAAAAPRRAQPPPPPSLGGLLFGLAFLFAFVLALPVLVIIGSLPSGLLTALIISVGLRQAWRMTAAPLIDVYGPYRVGGAPGEVAV